MKWIIKVKSILLCLILALSIVPVMPPVQVYASSQANRIAEIALGEVGKPTMGCAAFISHCARLAGIPTTVIPNMTTASGFWFANDPHATLRYFFVANQDQRARGLSNGIYLSSRSQYTPRVGDLVFFKWTPSSSYKACTHTFCHVEIVYAVDANRVYTVGANTSRGTRATSFSRNDPQIVAYATPNYSNATIISVPTGAPTNLRVNNYVTQSAAVNNSLFAVNNGDRVAITWDAVANATRYRVEPITWDGARWAVNSAFTREVTSTSVDYFNLLTSSSAMSWGFRVTAGNSTGWSTNNTSWYKIHVNPPAPTPANVTATIRYDASGGTGAPNSHSVIKARDGLAVFSLSMTIPTRSGYDFVGWLFENDFHHFTAYGYDSPGQNIAIALDPVRNEIITFYAQWESTAEIINPTAKIATINYNANGGVGAPESHSVIKESDGGAFFSLSLDVPFKEGYRFTGWLFENDPVHLDIYGIDPPGKSIGIGLNPNNDETLTFYAQWEKIPVTSPNVTATAFVLYNPNGGEGEPESYSIEINKDGQVTFDLSSVIPTKEGYKFLGWRLENSEEFRINNPGQNMIIIVEPNVSIALTFYAQWEKILIPLPELSQTTPQLEITNVTVHAVGNSVQGFECEVTNVGVLLKWDNLAGALGYRVYRSENPNDEGISITDFYITCNEFIDVNVRANTTYYYSVRGVLKEASPLSNLSEELSATTPKTAVTTEAITGRPPNALDQRKFILMTLDDPYMNINGNVKEIDPGRGTTPVLLNDRTVVPIRAIVEGMGGNIGWNEVTLEITLNLRDINVQMWVGGFDIYVNGTKSTMDVVPTIINNRTMIPLRFAAENLDCTVYWINSTRQIVIIYD
jgi:uncharacterized repeat protein (TIGR02543 family)